MQHHELIEGSPKKSLPRRALQFILGTTSYDPLKAEEQIYSTIQRSGLEGVNRIRSAESAWLIQHRDAVPIDLKDFDSPAGESVPTATN